MVLSSCNGDFPLLSQIAVFQLLAMIGYVVFFLLKKNNENEVIRDESTRYDDKTFEYKELVNKDDEDHEIIVL